MLICFDPKKERAKEMTERQNYQHQIRLHSVLRLKLFGLQLWASQSYISLQQNALVIKNYQIRFYLIAKIIKVLVYTRTSKHMLWAVSFDFSLQFLYEDEMRLWLCPKWYQPTTFGFGWIYNLTIDYSGYHKKSFPEITSPFEPKLMTPTPSE